MVAVLGSISFTTMQSAAETGALQCKLSGYIQVQLFGTSLGCTAAGLAAVVKLPWAILLMDALLMNVSGSALLQLHQIVNMHTCQLVSICPLLLH